ncbi:MAG: hypothetical protein JXB15_01890 [Anaerolineales bacterium]|nr:hypothetical protein [Anaerolineales bacterium]
MGIYFDEKGKFFTDVISKEAVQVIIQTTTNRVRGRLHVRPGHRLKDEINQSELFLAITDATVYDLSGQLLYQTEFLAINREHLVWLLPEDQRKTQGGEE